MNIFARIRERKQKALDRARESDACLHAALVMCQLIISGKKVADMAWRLKVRIERLEREAKESSCPK